MKKARYISLCITTYNRVDMTIRSFQRVATDPRISEIIVLDDGSDDQLYKELSEKLIPFDKVQKFQMPKNSGVYAAKKQAITLAFNDWCIVFDSDNIIGPDYIDRLYEIDKWDPSTSYLPSFAKPVFDYRHFAGEVISRETVASYMDVRMFDCLINTMNGFYNKNKYWQAWDPKVEPLTADSMYMNYLLLSAGNSLTVVPGLEYEHTIHDGSHYKKFSGENIAFRDYVMKLYKEMQ
jgi:glycosyltransferase involved in cell wall biosynthesis